MYIEERQGHRFLLIPNVEPNGFIWYVECLTCGRVVHPATMNPLDYINQHIFFPEDALDFSTIERDSFFSFLPVEALPC